MRGKAAKTKKLKQYEDQDEDDRQLAMQLLASAGELAQLWRDMMSRPVIEAAPGCAVPGLSKQARQLEAGHTISRPS